MWRSFASTQLSICVCRLGGPPGRQLYNYKPSPLQPQFLQFAYLSNCSVILCYPYCACCYCQCIIQHMHRVIHHLWHISTLYREKWNIHCYVDYIFSLWRVPEDDTSVSKHVAYIYICYKLCITQYILWTIYWLFFILALFHCTIKVTTHKYRSKLDMVSQLLIHFVLLTVYCSTVVCTFVKCGSEWFDKFTGCAE